MLSLLTHVKRVGCVGTINKTLEESCCNSCLGLNGSNLTPSWLSIYLITKSLRGKWVPFLFDCICFKVEKIVIADKERA